MRGSLKEKVQHVHRMKYTGISAIVNASMWAQTISTNNLSFSACALAVPKMMMLQSLLTLATCALSQRHERQADWEVMNAIGDPEGPILLFSTKQIVLKT